MSADVWVALGVGALIGLARWREYQWRRSPLGQASAVLERGQRARLRQRRTLERWHAFEWCVLVGVLVVLIAWAVL